MSVPSKDQLKQRSKHLSQILLEKYGIKVSNGHCLEIISKLFGFKDWNTASASADSAPCATSDSFEDEFLQLLARREAIENAWKADDERGVAVTGHDFLLEFDEAFTEFVTKFKARRNGSGTWK